MKILMLTPYLPYPPSSGGQIRSYNLIKQLSKKHQITLCSLIKYESEKKYIDNLKKYCQEVFVFKRAEHPWSISNILKTATSLYPFLVIRNYSKDEKKKIQEILQNHHFDIIHAETFYVSPHIPKTKIPIVLVDQTIEFEVYQHFVNNFPLFFLRPLLMIDVLKIKFWETYFWKKASRVIAVSVRDAAAMKNLVKNLNVDVVPNGVGEDLIENPQLHFSQTILFMGNYAWLQNIEAAQILAKVVFPQILKQIPGVQLLIAGQNTDKLVDLKGDHITLLNLKIDDIEGVKKAYLQSGVLVAPLYGPGGTRLKILGAMATKVPVVTTQIGIEGIAAENNESVLVGQSSQELANLTVSLLNDKKKYEKIAQNARKLVEEEYSYEKIAQNLSQIYESFKKD
ncbi:MAG: glycosyltransferase family 4 protein [Candidatus Daviesbacteria bacterium]|nr:glycosyltransferase family 4 protein [Candidatus Daviesbacteria bacterium]